MAKFVRQWVWWLAIVLGFVQPAFGAPAKDYVIGPSDVVRVMVYGHQDLVTEARVSEANKITFPLIGEVEIGGMTSQQAESRIAQALDEGGFVKQPQVQISVTQYRSQQVSLLGQVNRPGRYAIETPSKLSDMLALAGGINAVGSDTIVFVSTRNGKTQEREIDTVSMLQEGQLGLDTDVANGDIIYVPRAPVFYIYGEVQRPGSFRLEKNMTVVQALSVGGGLTPRGTDSRIRIKRRDKDGKVKTLTAELTDTVHPDDVIFVREALF
jgi:polysaccharide export outer membrane protein